MSALREEFGALGRLAVPIVLANVGTMAMGMVDTIMVGHLDQARALAGMLLAHVWIHGTVMFAMGVVFGIDPIVTQAHGARDGELLGLALQRGIVLGLIVSAFVMGLWTLTADFLELTGQRPATIAVADEYTRVQIFSVAPFLVFIALRQYLQGRGVLLPILWVVVLANVANALFNWVLIFGHLGSPALGVRGAGIATGLTRVVMLLALVAVILGSGLQRGAWLPWSRRAFSPAGLREVLRFGIPTAFQMSFEIWAFGCAALMAGKLSDAAASAHSVVLNLVAMTFMAPLGISCAACTRVGNLIGERRLARAQTAAWVAFGMGAGVMAIAAIALLVTGTAIPALFFDDTSAPDVREVLALCATIVPIAAAFQVFDGTQVVGCGILRAMGRTLPAAAINLVGYWMLALPIGAWMTFELGMGLAGVWWGLALALALVAAALLAWVRWRGPARDALEVELVSD